jgi:tetratricopeptide (TPR) repeat protein
MSISSDTLSSQGKAAFDHKKYTQAAELFEQAAQAYDHAGDALMAAEMQNNRSVALLQAGKPGDALEAVTGTDKVFEQAKDTKRQAMAFGNQGAALEELKRYEEALKAYEKSSELFGEVGETEMRSMIMQSAATIKLRQGKVLDSAFSMMGSVESTQRPTLWQRILRFFMRFIK